MLFLLAGDGICITMDLLKIVHERSVTVLCLLPYTNNQARLLIIAFFSNEVT